MAVQLFWDANFKVKTLTPVLADALGLASPAAQSAGSPNSLELTLPQGTVITMLYFSDTTHAALIDLSLDGSTYEAGAIPSAAQAVIEIPCTGVLKIKITCASAVLTVGYAFLTVPS